MTISKPTVTLTRRDLKLFHSLGHFGMLSTSQLELRIYPGVQNSTVLRRLRRLERAGWIYRIKALESGELVWLLTRKGEAETQVEHSMIRPNPSGVAHDVLLVALRMRLESIGLGENFVPDWSVRRQTFDPSRSRREGGQLVPDGFFSATLWNDTVTTVALELELSAKTTQRYERIFTKYLGKDKIRHIWYFVETEAFADALIAKWNWVMGRTYRSRKWPGHFIVTVLPKFEKDPRGALLRFSDGETREVQEHFKVSEPPSETAQAVGRADEEQDAREGEEIAS